MSKQKLPDEKLTQVVIPGYELLTQADRAKVDKVVREHMKKRGAAR